MHCRLSVWIIFVAVSFSYMIQGYSIFPPLSRFHLFLTFTNHIENCCVAFVLLAFVVLQCLRLRPEETLGEVKERIQRKTFLGDVSDPIPLRSKVSMSHLLTA